MMSKFTRKLGAALAVAACATFVGGPVLASHKVSGNGTIQLRHIAANGELGGLAPPSPATFEVNTKTGQVKIKASGTVANAANRKSKHQGVSITLFPTVPAAPPSVVVKYDVQANGSAKLDGKN